MYVLKSLNVLDYNRSMKKFQWMRITGLCFTVSLIVGMIGGALTNEYFVAYVFDRFIQEQQEQTPIVKKVIEQHSYVEESKTIDAVEKVEPVIVSLTLNDTDAGKIIDGEINRDESFLNMTSDRFYLNRNPADDFIKGSLKGGTGFFISSDGLIATCSSIASLSSEWSLITSEDKLYHATVVYDDPYDDFSLLKINDNDKTEYFPTITFAEQELKNGQKALVIGRDVFKKYRVLSSIVAHAGLPQADDIAVTQKRIFPNEFVIIDTEIDRNTKCGPVVNLGGELMGMALDFDSTEPGTSYVIPLEALKEKFYEYQEMID